jgi:hypothetical protein
VWFDFRNGRVAVKNPDDEIIAKMQRLPPSLAREAMTGSSMIPESKLRDLATYTP